MVWYCGSITILIQLFSLLRISLASLFQSIVSWRDVLNNYIPIFRWEPGVLSNHIVRGLLLFCMTVRIDLKTLNVLLLQY